MAGIVKSYTSLANFVKYQKLILPIVITVVLIAGIYLVWLVASRFLTNAPANEISFGTNEATGTQELINEGEVNYPAPGFELADLPGNKIKLSDYNEKTVVLNFWTTWNPACQDQLKILDSYYQEIKDNQNVVVLAVNNQEDKSLVSNFITRGKYELPVLLDEKGEVGDMYKVTILPMTYFINPQLRVAEKYIGILNETELKEKVARLSSP